jgi:iron complex outermembrane receptor protein
VTGLYYVRRRFSLFEPVTFNGATSTSLRKQIARSYAVFGQATYRIAEGLSVSAGARQTWDKKSVDTTPAGVPTARHFEDSWNNLSIEAGAEYRIDNRKLLYFRFAEGYRSGGINGGVASIATKDAYDPETAKSYEIGAKTEWFDRRLTLNVSAFQSDYEDLQVNVTISNGVRPIRNAASARIRGVELESIVRPSDRLTITATAGYLDPKYKKFFAYIGSGTPTDNTFLTFLY